MPAAPERIYKFVPPTEPAPTLRNVGLSGLLRHKILSWLDSRVQWASDSPLLLLYASMSWSEMRVEAEDVPVDAISEIASVIAPLAPLGFCPPMYVVVPESIMFSDWLDTAVSCHLLHQTGEYVAWVSWIRQFAGAPPLPKPRLHLGIWASFESGAQLAVHQEDRPSRRRRSDGRYEVSGTPQQVFAACVSEVEQKKAHGEKVRAFRSEAELAKRYDDDNALRLAENIVSGRYMPATSADIEAARARRAAARNVT